MKKLLLIALALGVGFASFAQNQKRNLNAITKAVPFLSAASHRPIIDPVTTVPGGLNGPVKPSQHITTAKGPKGTLNKVEFSSSGNMLCVEFPQITTLSSIPGLNLVGFTHRAGGDYGATSNYLKLSYTSNDGAHFDSVMIATSNVAPLYPRYPSGVLTNPASNTTDPTHAVLAYGGPYTNATNWQGQYLCSERLAADTVHMGYLPLPSTTYQAAIELKNLASCINDQTQTVHGFIAYEALTTDSQYGCQPPYVRVFNAKLTAADSVKWWSDTTRFAPPHFVAIPSDAPGVNYFNEGQAWNEDGSVGYIYFFGVDSTEVKYSMGPIVYKSIDKGATWTKLPIFDFSTISQIEDSIYPTRATAALANPVAIPNISPSEQSGAVDNNGNLHIIAIIRGMYSVDPDSLGYSYTQEAGHLYDLYTKTAGGWGEHYITSIKSQTVEYTNAAALTYSGGNSIGWDHRLFLSRTTDGKKMFAFWNDVQDSTVSPALTVPDILGYAWDNSTGYGTPVKNFTLGTAYDGENYWMYVANKVIKSGSDYNIPITTTITNTDGTATSQCYHYYLTGISFNDADFTGINEVKGNISSVLQNYPNPFRGTTTITVSLNKASDISLSVSNMIGQKVYESDKGSVSAGTHTYTFDGTELQSGIYFYTIKSGDNTVTNKMIIE